MAIEQAQWQWFGSAGHFIGGSSCRFHMTTKLGKHLISTVGAYYPTGKEKTPEEIGYERTYETMVFRVKGRCPCGCGLPTIIPTELDFAGYNDAKAARLGHMKLCRAWAKKEGDK